jgi:hypothetical protein
MWYNYLIGLFAAATAITTTTTTITADSIGSSIISISSPRNNSFSLIF